jgi:2-polyprenyl-6-methoxyphenol hydroxylase-like FAD-dependent oxidoreductase
MDTEVLIVGAGPTGLMLANQLARRGITAVIIDRHSGPAEQTRAMAVHARTMEIYAKLGIAERAVQLGKRADGANVWANGRHTARLQFANMGADLSPFPFVLMLGQDDNELLMGARLTELGVSIAWSTELIAFEQRDQHIEATIKGPDGSMQTLRAAYIAGCDGSRSTVREICKIGFPGAPYEHVFFVADTVTVGAMVPNELNVYLWRDGFHLFFPMHGTDRWRVIGILPPELRGTDALEFNDLAPSITREVGGELEFKSCAWFSTYRIQHRCVERFRERRAFLLGDAAHIHSPMGGQGMNTGLQDAYNLAWKLALVLRGHADEPLLDSYEAERMPVAQELLRTTDRAFSLIVSTSPVAALMRTKIIARMAALAMQRQFVRTRAFKAISQIGIRYPRSTLSKQDVMSGPQAGDRFPWMRLIFEANGPAEDLFQKLDDTRFTVLTMGSASPDDLEAQSSLVRALAIPRNAHNDEVLARMGIAESSLYVLRPDGHIGAAFSSHDVTAVEDYFASIGVRLRMEANLEEAAPAPVVHAANHQAATSMLNQ